MKNYTSAAVVRMASQSSLGRMLRRKVGLYSSSDWASSASWKCRGKEEGLVLQVFMAQVKKFAVRSFMVDWICGGGLVLQGVGGWSMVIIKKKTF